MGNQRKSEEACRRCVCVWCRAVWREEASVCEFNKNLPTTAEGPALWQISGQTGREFYSNLNYEGLNYQRQWSLPAFGWELVLTPHPALIHAATTQMTNQYCYTDIRKYNHQAKGELWTLPNLTESSVTSSLTMTRTGTTTWKAK